jgi:hypothetical protein
VSPTALVYLAHALGDSAPPPYYRNLGYRPGSGGEISVYIAIARIESEGIDSECATNGFAAGSPTAWLQ